VKVDWMLSCTYHAVGVVGAFGGMVSKCQTVVALGVRSEGEVFLNLELSAKEG
jgi:hypothetical protein